MPGAGPVGERFCFRTTQCPGDNESYAIPCNEWISMTSIEDCGIWRCGCPSNDFAAASCDSACTTEYNMMSFLVWDVPRVLTSLVLPRPAPPSTNIFALSAIHFFHWACIFVSA